MSFDPTGRKNFNVEEGSLPSSLTSLKLLDYSGCTLTTTTIPSSVVKLTLTALTVTGSAVPRSVKRLTFSNRNGEFDRKLNELPDKLEHLDLLCHQDSDDLAALPSGITMLSTLILHYKLWMTDQLHKVGQIPPGVRDLRLSLHNVQRDNVPILVALPLMLTSLTTLGEFRYDGGMPTNLKHLTINSLYDTVEMPSMLPTSITEFYIDKELQESDWGSNSLHNNFQTMATTSTTTSTTASTPSTRSPLQGVVTRSPIGIALMFHFIVYILTKYVEGV
ncbi:hypothetical protein SAMD00019534_126590 [Acytostelium subglobosum LB1]|uniref:hypothetical protein n=1 Tax=Acytostelium subglobosum LB1 TaxID=1410327 RepID=UPI000644E17B|nr:hypothetical protein SAMD00019534_126590 [Acytostelium subglobosum LB1]GAM29483.1 hypothetical protein SAMD00019534_126590 [Acytostelium subglobosum LB1]|eukprot:XP_012747569.1 hypothetical protein SAMD00019534_126590 [Acytostelium subglobosum LB1]